MADRGESDNIIIQSLKEDAYNKNNQQNTNKSWSLALMKSAMTNVLKNMKQRG